MQTVSVWLVEVSSWGASSSVVNLATFKDVQHCERVKSSIPEIRYTVARCIQAEILVQSVK